MKIGIITHYYNSQNYGGNLQAYALCRVLNKMGHDAQQISFDRSKDKGALRKIKKALRWVKRNIITRDRQDFAVRKKAILSFNQSIPHSTVYSEKTVHIAGDKYDAFITGSDQVWHPVPCCDAYLLKFAPENKIKISYAASIAHDEIPKKKIQWYKDGLKSFNAVSVREKEAVDLLQGISPVEIQRTLDPTLLLSREEWEEIAKPANISEPYLFCYFLGDRLGDRKLAEEFAEKKGIKIVALPYLQGNYRECDKDFGDIKLFDVSPNRLISLIRDAEFVFTDSFHAAVFSIVFEKEFFVFSRSEYKKMSSRIVDLLSMFNLMERFCDTDSKVNCRYMESLPPVSTGISFDEYLSERDASIAFLENNLNDEN